MDVGYTEGQHSVWCSIRWRELLVFLVLGPFSLASLFALALPSMFVYALIFLIMMLCLDEFMAAMM